ncbi:MAG: hypothetical protein ACE5MH_05730 [Terriglobia bacterium]
MGEARVRLVVKRKRCSEHGLAEHALLFEESAFGRRRRRQLRRVVCLVCDPREFVRLRAHYRR